MSTKIQKQCYYKLNYLQRAYKICNTWQEFHQEVQHIKQVLINNNFTNTVVDNHIKTFISNRLHNQKPLANKTKTEIFYKNQMHVNYKLE